MITSPLSGSGQTLLAESLRTKATSASPDKAAATQDTVTTEAYALDINKPKDASQTETRQAPVAPDKDAISSLFKQFMANPATLFAAQANSMPKNAISLLDTK